MKQQLILDKYTLSLVSLIAGSFLIAATASAQSVSIRPQSHPLRIRVGVADSGNVALGFSYDVGADQRANRLSLYGDAFGDLFSRNAWGNGVSLRHELPTGWIGIGVGNYGRNSGAFSTHTTLSRGIGGKVFIGSGKGRCFIEASTTFLPKKATPVPAFNLGVRF